MKIKRTSFIINAVSSLVSRNVTTITITLTHLHTQATMLKKIKNKMKRRNTEPSMALASTSGPTMPLAVAPPDNDENDSNNTDF